MTASSPQPEPRRIGAPVAADGALAQALQVTRESLAALQRMQEHSAHLHRQYLEGQESAQRTVHVLVEQQQRLLQAGLGLPSTVRPMPPLEAPHAAPSPPPPERAVVAAPPAVAPALPTRRVEFVRPAPVAVPVASSRVQEILLEVIAEKTGYPAEMLDMGMALDADLGIDSIKRVEILSALQERLPDAPIVKPEHLGTLHNLQQIVEFLDDGRTSEIVLQIAVPPVATSQQSTASHNHVQNVLLEVIAEKTGYPTEMLDLGMALDADLGIDSIKRVEILSALQERLPDAPIVKPEHLGTLHDLQQIVTFLSNGKPNGGGRAEEGSSYLPQPPPVRDSLQRSVLQAVPFVGRQSRPAVRLTPGSEVWLTADNDELTKCVEIELIGRGLRPRRIDWSGLDGMVPPAILGGLVLLSPANGMTDAQLRSALLGAQRLSSALRAGRGIFVTISRLDGQFGLGDPSPEREPIDGGLAGLAKTAGLEWTEVSCKALDLATDILDRVKAATELAEEMLLAGPVEVGVTASARWQLRRVNEEICTQGKFPLKTGDVVVVTGGARGVTAEIAVALASACRPTLILLGRSLEPGPEPDWLAKLSSEADIKRELGVRANGSANLKAIGEQYRRVAAQREVRQVLARIEAAGARAIYRAVDVRDAAAVAAMLEPLRQELGPVRGLIHGAGVLADARIQDKTGEQFDLVYQTKVVGLRSLLACLPGEDLRALVLFSSTTARLGRAGQVDYAMANEVLNKIAQRQSRRWPHCRVVSVNWGPWDGGMVTPSLKKVFENEGVGLISPEAGGNFLVRELSDPARDVEVVVVAGGLPSAEEPVVSPSVAAILPIAFEREVSLEECPILASHVIDGRPVLPMALTLEWLAHAALHHNPGRVFAGIKHLRILHGVKLMVDRPTVLRVAAGKGIQGDGEVTALVELHGTRTDGRDVLHARAEVVLTDRLPSVPPVVPIRSLLAYPYDVDEIYSTHLFHGPELRAIEHVHGCDANGIVADVRSAPAPAVWLRRPLRQKWLADPLVLDAAFQLMILWSLERHGAPNLPCYIKSYRQFRKAFPAEGARIVCRVVRDTPSLATADVDLLAADGQLLARIEGFECAIDPALARAFQRNQPMGAPGAIHGK